VSSLFTARYPEWRKNFMFTILKQFYTSIWLGLDGQNCDNSLHGENNLLIPTFILLYKSTVRYHLNYCCSVRNPYRKGDIEALEKVQKRATKMLPALKHLSRNVCRNVIIHTGTALQTHYGRVYGHFPLDTSPGLSPAGQFALRTFHRPFLPA